MFEDTQLIWEAHVQSIQEGVYDDVQTKWGRTTDASKVKSTIDQFRKLKQNQIINPSEDIQQWAKRPFDEFQQFVGAAENKLQSKVVEKSKSRDVDKVFENELALVIRPNTHAAACKYGAGTKWCITSRDGNDWKMYKRTKSTIYYILSKSQNNAKYAVKVDHTYTGGSPVITTYLSNDENTSLHYVTQKFRIPKNIFTGQVDDPNVWLKSIKHRVNKDGSIDILESVGWFNLGMNKLPPFNINRVYGNYNCGNNALVSLVGAPHRVDGNFYCFRNQLTSLEGIPQYIGGDLNCSDNKLESLTEVNVVRGEISFYNNQLKSIADIPKHLRNKFDKDVWDSQSEA